jgi:hypothetical protein
MRQLALAIVAILAAASAFALGASQQIALAASAGPLIGLCSGGTLAGQKVDRSVGYGSGHLNVYLDFYACGTGGGAQYVLQVQTSNGDLMDDTYRNVMNVRAWACTIYQGTWQGPQENGHFSHATDWTDPVGLCLAQADDLNSAIYDTLGRKYSLPYLHF